MYTLSVTGVNVDNERMICRSRERVTLRRVLTRARARAHTYTFAPALHTTNSKRASERVTKVARPVYVCICCTLHCARCIAIAGLSPARNCAASIAARCTPHTARRTPHAARVLHRSAAASLRYTATEYL